MHILLIAFALVAAKLLLAGEALYTGNIEYGGLTQQRQATAGRLPLCKS
jgi:hypothetical protein